MSSILVVSATQLSVILHTSKPTGMLVVPNLSYQHNPLALPHMEQQLVSAAGDAPPDNHVLFSSTGAGSCSQPRRFSSDRSRRACARPEAAQVPHGTPLSRWCSASNTQPGASSRPHTRRRMALRSPGFTCTKGCCHKVHKLFNTSRIKRVARSNGNPGRTTTD